MLGGSGSFDPSSLARTGAFSDLTTASFSGLYPALGSIKFHMSLAQLKALGAVSTATFLVPFVVPCVIQHAVVLVNQAIASPAVPNAVIDLGDDVVATQWANGFGLLSLGGQTTSPGSVYFAGGSASKFSARIRLTGDTFNNLTAGDFSVYVQGIELT